ncbi:hypothetical protein KIL84_017176 [Mauremys mutica]|uniref:Uncharacterized protein n=1 Tax=Mauremys mutica TaxID=74926 RepID=A0A9D4ARE5_9SAUR|nr:hypothetical protein KIL84_017176 [Mauremys mutica]
MLGLCKDQFQIHQETSVVKAMHKSLGFIINHRSRPHFAGNIIHFFKGICSQEWIKMFIRKYLKGDMIGGKGYLVNWGFSASLVSDVFSSSKNPSSLHVLPCGRHWQEN